MVYRTFPFRLYSILEDSAKDEGESSVISWTPDGKTFKIHDLEAFKERILPKYLPKQSKYKSFKRQLQYYGFSNFGSSTYGHHSFLRDEKSLLSQIEHRAFKKTKIGSMTSSSSSKPSSNPIPQDAKACKPSEGDAENASSTPTTSSGILATRRRSSTSTTVASSASLLRDTLQSSATFATPSMASSQHGLQNQLLLSLAAGGLPSHGLGALSSSFPPTSRQTTTDDALPSLSPPAPPPSNKALTAPSTNGLLSTLLATQMSPSAASLASSPLLALELEYQRQRQQQQQAQEAALRAQLILSLATPSASQIPEQATLSAQQEHHQQQRRRESLERLALLNGLGALQQYEV